MTLKLCKIDCFIKLNRIGWQNGMGLNIIVAKSKLYALSQVYSFGCKECARTHISTEKIVPIIFILYAEQSGRVDDSRFSWQFLHRFTRWHRHTQSQTVYIKQIYSLFALRSSRMKRRT